MSWARSSYLREWSSLYRHRRIMSSHLCSEWSLWSFLSKMSKVSNTLIMLIVITSDSSDQSNHFETLITQWLFNHCYYIINCERVLTTKYIQACDKKSKIIKKQKCSEYWKIMQNVEQFLKELFKTAKWARNAVTNTLTQATIFFLIKSECFDIITTMQNKVKMMF